MTQDQTDQNAVEAAVGEREPVGVGAHEKRLRLVAILILPRRPQERQVAVEADPAAEEPEGGAAPTADVEEAHAGTPAELAQDRLLARPRLRGLLLQARGVAGRVIAAHAATGLR